MCYNYALNTSIKSLESRFKANIKGNIKLPVYHANAFSFGEMPVITNQHSGNIELFHWGLIPSWIKEDKKAMEIKKYTLNAKSETIFKKPAFRSSIISKRCLIPATGFFEWQHINKDKIPYYIFLAEKELFSFAGIWDSFMSDNGHEINTFSIITTEADEFNAKIHNTKKRMPLIIDIEMEQDWLNSELKKEEIEVLMKKRDLKFDAYQVNGIPGNKKINTNVPEILMRNDNRNINYTLFH